MDVNFAGFISCVRSILVLGMFVIVLVIELFVAIHVVMYRIEYPVKPCKPADRSPLKSVRLLDQVRERIRYKHFSIRTEEAYVYWMRGFYGFTS